MVRRPRLRWTVNTAVGGPTSDQDRESDVAIASVRDLTSEHIGVQFQPIVDLATGAVFAHEALVRCSVEAFSDPSVLFERAVEESAVGRLGRAVREATFARLTRGRVFLNIHPEELRNRWLIRPDDPMCLHEGELYLEITEQAAMEYFELCQSVLSEVCARTGAHLVVDDFGAGHSNLKRVLELEPSIVKLDRSLVVGIAGNRRQQILVRQLVALCEALDAKVVVEGIETADEVAAVRDSGAHLAQGYYFGRPSNDPV